MRKLFIIAVAVVQVVTLAQLSGNLASAQVSYACSDGRDNDTDGFTDIADNACHSDPLHPTSANYEPTFNSEHYNSGQVYACSDGRDNDTDGFTDRDDNACHSDPEHPTNANYEPTFNSEHYRPSTRPQCSNGRDDDGRGDIDAQDPDCYSGSGGSYNPNDNTEFSSCVTGSCNPPPQNRAPVCTVNSAFYVNRGQNLQFSVNTSDADGDTRIIASDNLLTSIALAQLQDGGANFVQLPTQNSWNFSWTPSAAAETRTYEIDLKVTDGRGGIDYCSTAITVRPNNNNPPPVYDCSDNIDNDGDQAIDYPADPGCYGPTDNNEYNPTSSTNGNTNTNTNNNNNNNVNTNTNVITIGGGYYGGGNYYDDYECDDGRDNDNDGDYDYPEDRGCRSYTDNSEDSEDNDNDAECNDNRDNDNDGDEDYPDDTGCSSRNDDSEDSDDNDNNNDRPEVTTRSASSIGDTSVTLNGRVDGNGLSTRVWFEYSDDRDDVDNDEETSEDSIGSGTESFSERITGLRRNTTYYFRAVARNSQGTDYGTILSFRTGEDNDEPECDDNRDNDNDGDEDYPDDRGCSSRSDDSEDSDRRSSNRGRIPYFTSTPLLSARAGQSYSYNADALDPDGDSLTYSLAVRPSGMTINSFTGVLQWFAPANLGGTYQPVLVVAEDSDGNQASQSYIISVQYGSIVNQPVNPGGGSTATTPVRIFNLSVVDDQGSVIVSFNTNVPATGSVRYGQTSEIEKTANFTYPQSQQSQSGQNTFHQINLGPLAVNQTYYLRAFATDGVRSANSPELAFARLPASVETTTEVAGTASCFDGIDNDRDGVADAADSDCEADQNGGGFATALETLGTFLISPWFLLLVIIALIVYLLTSRRRHELITATGPIEIKS